MGASPRFFLLGGRSLRGGGERWQTVRQSPQRSSLPSPPSTSELYDVEITGTGRARVVRVLIDRDGGIDLDAITRATEAVMPILDGGSIDDTLAGLVHPRSEQPRARATVAAPGALPERDGIHGVDQAAGGRRARAADPRRGGRRRRRRVRRRLDTGDHRARHLRRHRAGAHRLRVGPQARRRSGEARKEVARS